MAKKKKKIGKTTQPARKVKDTGKAQQTKEDRTGDGTDELVDMEQAIETLKTTKPTFYRWLRDGKVRGFKVGRQWRFYKSEIERFVKGEAPVIALPANINPLLESLRNRASELDIDLALVRNSSDIEEAVALIIRIGAAVRASDIHIEPHSIKNVRESIAVIRYRVDGVLQAGTEADIRLLPAIIEQLKRMAACNIHENAKAQDGRILLELKESQKRLDIRVCFLPAALGESATIRVLDPDAVHVELDLIDYSPNDMERLTRALQSPWGTIIVTGPTGSGKTTTLYAAVNELAGEDRRVITIEDPVEFLLPWVTQVQVRSNVGMTFSAILRSTLRSAPNVIMVGEVRDRETLQITHQASLTGHLLLTTLHTDDAVNALQRMVDIGSDPFLIAECVRLIVGQRLIRRLCEHCKKRKRPDRKHMAYARSEANGGGMKWAGLKTNFHQSVGCSKCAQTGFKGRTVIAETLVVSAAIGNALRKGASCEELRELAVSEGMTTMTADGIRRASAGQTTIEEVQRATGRY